MKLHFEHLADAYGDASVRLPNGLFRELSTAITNRSGKVNSQQVAFAYTYLLTVSFLYKYAHFIDGVNGTYVQNADIKALLGYSKATKSIDSVIRKGGVLDRMGLTETVRDIPIRFDICHTERINGIALREFTFFRELPEDDLLYDAIKETVKNRNYEVKHPLFLTTITNDSEYGTLYDVRRTHQITLREFLWFLSDDNLDNIDFLLYGYIKSRCKGYPGHRRSMAVYKMVKEIGIDRSTFYGHLTKLKEQGVVKVDHKAWQKKQEAPIPMEANDYYWVGLQEKTSGALVTNK